MFNKDALRQVIVEYKKQFSQWWLDEQFKWQSIKYFNENWDIDAADFHEMITNTLNKPNIYAGMLASANNFPVGFIVAASKKEPETVRKMFVDLFNEDVDIYERIVAFKSTAEMLRQKHFPNDNNHYQGENAITTYLWLKYPDKYYIYKFSEVKAVSLILSSNYQFKKGAYEPNIRNSLCLYNEICEELKKDSELIAIINSVIDDTCYSDPQLRTLAIDIGFFISRKIANPDNKTEDLYPGYWPLLKEYNPKITKEQWIDFLDTDRVSFPSTLAMLKAMLELGGEATCKKLGEVLNVKANACVMRGANLGRRVKKSFDLPPCMDKDVERFFSIPFLWKATVENNQDLAIWRLRPELQAALEEMDLSDISPYYDEDGEDMNNTNIAKNTILYGPPGTGKTYNAVCYAVAIVENKPIEKVMTEASSENGYAEVFNRYKEYKNQGLIAFSTFHQSYGYEEFIEGIKPVMDSDDDEQSDIKYSVTDGVFKEFCENATSVISVDKKTDIGLNNSPSVWKVSLWATGDNHVRTECLENGHIRIGWDYYGPDITSETDFSACGGRNVLNSFLYKMKVGDIVLSCYSSTTVDAVGIVTGDYEWSGDYEELNRVRKVNWLVKGINEDIFEMNNNTVFTLPTVYKTQISVADALSIVEKHSDIFNERGIEQKNRVFIIDEINRGNISKIFGELITLIEPSKRLGAKEETKAILPYSKSAFGVPDNVYILGTMNTADRSIAALDTALRRRFDFIEMMPDDNVLAGVDVDGIDISKMLKKINERIEVLFDREHTIGHAYFIDLKDDDSVDALADIFRNKVIPLLQEYFYEDYERIRLVLADNQVTDKNKQFIIADDVRINDLFGTNDIDILEDSKHYSINSEAFKNKDAYIKIYDK